MINTPGGPEISEQEKERIKLGNDYKTLQAMYFQFIEDTKSEELMHKAKFSAHFANFISGLLQDNNDTRARLMVYALLQLLTKYIDVLWQIRKDDPDEYMKLITQDIELSSAYLDPTKSPDKNPRYGFAEYLEHIFVVSGYDFKNTKNREIFEEMVKIRNK